MLKKSALAINFCRRCAVSLDKLSRSRSKYTSFPTIPPDRSKVMMVISSPFSDKRISAQDLIARNGQVDAVMQANVVEL
jgi:hypothetical protein